MSHPYQWSSGDQPPELWRDHQAPKTPKPPKPMAPIQHSEEEKLEAAAALGAYDELGPVYQDAVVEAFLAKMDALQAQRQPRQFVTPMPPPSAKDLRRANRKNPDMAALIVCLALSIPLTAISGGIAGIAGIFICWVGIAVVAFTLGYFRKRD